jgi:hypothetical protein
VEGSDILCGNMFLYSGLYTYTGSVRKFLHTNKCVFRKHRIERNIFMFDTLLKIECNKMSFCVNAFTKLLHNVCHDVQLSMRFG